MNGLLIVGDDGLGWGVVELPDGKIWDMGMIGCEFEGQRVADEVL